MALLLSLGLLIYIVPKFSELFSSARTQLPALTRIIMACSSSLQHYGLLALITITALFTLFYISWRKNKRFRLIAEKLLTKLPGIRRLITTSQAASCLYILATLIKAGIPLAQALKMTAQTSSYRIYQQMLLLAHQSVMQGSHLTHSLKQSHVLDSDILSMIAIGEQAGRLEPMLFNIASLQNQQLQKLIAYLSKWLEPVIMLVIGIIVGTVIIAMYLPILKLNSLFLNGVFYGCVVDDFRGYRRLIVWQLL